MDRDAILTALRVSADDLQREVARLPAAAALWRAAEGEWSQHECLTHLVIAEQHIFLPRIRALLEQDNPVVMGMDETALQKQLWRAEQPRDELLAGFLQTRQAELALLEHADWARPGVHSAMGPIDIGWVAQYALGHTWEHMSQIVRVRLKYEIQQRAQAGQA